MDRVKHLKDFQVIEFRRYTVKEGEREHFAEYMDVVFAVQISLKGEIGKSVAGAIELFHGGLEFLPGASGHDQFRLYRKVNTHLLNMPQPFYLRKEPRIPLHPKRSIYV